MIKNLKKILKSKFAKNVIIVATGAVGAQAITLLLSPLITRIYGPEAFGILGTFTSLTKVIIPVAALTYPVAIVLPKSDINARKIMKFSLYLTVLVSIISVLILALFKHNIIGLFNLEDIEFLIYLIPLVILFAGIMQVSEQWIIRTNQFSINAKTTFLQSVITNLSKVGIGFFYPTAVVLVIIQACTEGLKALLITLSIRKMNYKSINKNNEKNLSYKELVKKHKDFPLYRAPEELFSSLSQNLPILLLTSFFGPAAAGFYTIGRTVLSMPSRLIGKAIGDVFYPRITEAANTGENLSKLIKKATFALVGVGIIPFSLVILFGPLLFSFVFGTEWTTAGEYARWIALFSFSTFINKPAVKSMPVLHAQRFHLFFTIFRATTRALALVVGFMIFDSDIIGVALFGITSFITNIMLISIVLKLSRTRMGER